MTATDFLMGALGALIAIVGGWPFVAMIDKAAGTGRKRRRTPNRVVRFGNRGRAEGRMRMVTQRLRNDELLRGGLMIGLLERAAVTLGILVGHPEALGAVVAIKGLGRFAELREHPAAAERFVIGSLASLVWAAGVATWLRWWIYGG